MPSDGLTPIQTRKLNQNFQRIVERFVLLDDDNGLVIDKAVAIAIDKVMGQVLDALMPVGTLLLAKSWIELPKLGEWREVTEFDGRYLRLGGNYGSKGGSATQDITGILAEHSHSYYKQVGGTKIKVDVSTSSSAKEVLQSVVDAEQPSDTGKAGDDDQHTISIQPPYVRMKLFERVA